MPWASVGNVTRESSSVVCNVRSSTHEDRASEDQTRLACLHRVDETFGRRALAWPPLLTRSFLTGLLFIVGGASGLTYAYIQRTAE